MKPGELHLTESENKLLDALLEGESIGPSALEYEATYGAPNVRSDLQMIRAKVRLALYRGRG